MFIQANIILVSIFYWLLLLSLPVCKREAVTLSSCKSTKNQYFGTLSSLLYYHVFPYFLVKQDKFLPFSVGQWEQVGGSETYGLTASQNCNGRFINYIEYQIQCKANLY